MIVDFNKIDINEKYLYAIPMDILKVLLKDKTTKKNILWATDQYSSLGTGYFANEQIFPVDIEGMTSIIKPRVVKTKEERTTRIRGKGEVFTPAWVCNKQNNLIDNDWFGRCNVFNRELENSWQTIEDKIIFPDTAGKTWKDYVKANRLEISCGEAPYLVSRYDAVTGELIPIKNRIGLLDRKLRVVSENVNSEPEWYLWSKKAIQSIYGYDWQGDNVLLARENLLFTFIDYYEAQFEVPPIKKYLLEIARILSWNIFQMDGIKFVETAKYHAKFLMTKFARAALYVNKISQMSTNAWGAVPVQDYSESWWDKSIDEIDEELFKKYSIPQEIADFVKNNIQTKTIENIVCL